MCCACSETFTGEGQLFFFAHAVARSEIGVCNAYMVRPPPPICKIWTEALEQKLNLEHFWAVTPDPTPCLRNLDSGSEQKFDSKCFRPQ